jgi:phosphoribosylamine-glycine ligase
MICTACTDQALLTVAKVSEELGLPTYLSYQTALNVTNKTYMKKLMIQNKIPTSNFIIANQSSIINVSELNFPVVVKPADCNSSKGVIKVKTPQDLLSPLQEAVAFSRTKTAIVEEYMEGEEISADFYIEGNHAKLLCATKSKKVRDTNSFTIIQSFYPAINERQENKLKEIGQQIANAFHITDSPLLVQLICKDDDMRVVEFSARMGGGSKYKFIEILSGVNIMEKYVDLLLGQKPSVTPRKQVAYASTNFIYCHPGIIKAIEGLDYLKEQTVIDEYFEYKTTGMEITQAKTSGDRPAGYIVTANSKEELERKILIADSTIKIINTNGKDIMIHGWI